MSEDIRHQIYVIIFLSNHYHGSLTVWCLPTVLLITKSLVLSLIILDFNTTFISGGDVVWLALSDACCWYTLITVLATFYMMIPLSRYNTGSRARNLSTLTFRLNTNRPNRPDTPEMYNFYWKKPWCTISINQTDTYPENSHCEFDLFDVYQRRDEFLSIS